MNEGRVRSKGVQRAVGCAVKGPLGCLAFTFGATAVLVLFLPPAAGKIVSRHLEEKFAERHEGTLRVHDAWVFSLYGPQSVNGIELLDPDGDQVLRGRLLAPSVLKGGGPGEPWGPIELSLSNVDVVEDETGRTNLSRALAVREGSFPTRFLDLDSRRGRLRVRLSEIGMSSESGQLGVEVRVGRLRYTDASGRSCVVRDLESRADLFVKEGRVQLEMTGDATIDGGDPGGLVFGWSVDDVSAWTRHGGDTPWEFSLHLEGVPTAFAEILAGLSGELESGLGPELRRANLSLRYDGEGARHIDPLHLVSSRARVDLKGSWDLEQNRIEAAGDEDRVLIDFQADDPWWNEHVVAGVLPLMDDVVIAGADRPKLRLSSFSFPADGQFVRGSARVEVGTDEVSFNFAPALVGQLGCAEGRQRVRGPLTVLIEDGRAVYKHFQLPMDGKLIEIVGSYDFFDDAYSLKLEMPGAPGRRTLRVEGERGTLELTPSEE